MKNNWWKVIEVRPLPDDIGVKLVSQLPDGRTNEQVITNHMMDKTMERLKFVSEVTH